VKQRLELKQEQRQVLSPLQIQSLMLLACPVQDVVAYVQQQLLENPVLEIDAFSRGKTREDFYDDIPVPLHEVYAGPAMRAEDRSRLFAVEGETFAQALLLQMDLRGLSAQETYAVRVVVEALDADGYLRIATDVLADQAGVEEAAVLQALRRVQTLEPTGIGARTVQECLLLQVTEHGAESDLLRRLICDHLQDLAAGRFVRVAKVCGVQETEVRQAYERLRQLSPRPIMPERRDPPRQSLAADLVVRKVDGCWQVYLYDAQIPELRIDPYYEALLAEDAEASKADRQYLRRHMRAARQLIGDLSRRKETLLRIAKLIVAEQEAFLEEGAAALRPLTLNDIAARMGVHESTVCRAVAGKYMDTPRGLISLRTFFPSAVPCGNGEVASSAFVCSRIRALVAAEDKTRPLSDQRIADLLREEGLCVARRTVAKYRDEMGVPSSVLRKVFVLAENAVMDAQ